MDFDFWSWGMEKYDRAVAEFDSDEFTALLRAGAEGLRRRPDVHTGTTTSDPAPPRLRAGAYREMGGFANFAISFTIISILAGCLTSYYIAFNYGGPVAITWGWLLVGAFCMLVAMAMGEIASAMPTAGGALLLGVQAGRPGVGLVHRLVQPGRSDRGDGRHRLRRGDLHHRAAQPLVPRRRRHRRRSDLHHLHGRSWRCTSRSTCSASTCSRCSTRLGWWHMIGVSSSSSC